MIIFVERNNNLKIKNNNMTDAGDVYELKVYKKEPSLIYPICLSNLEYHKIF